MIVEESSPRFGVVSPAGALPPEEFDAGVSALEKLGYRIRVFPHAREMMSYVSAPAAARVSDLNAAWGDSGLSAVLCSRGGFGSAHLLPLLDWKAMRRRRLPLLGFSDITALHLAMDKFGVGVPVASPMLRHFPEIDEYSLTTLDAALRRRDSSAGGFEVLLPGPVAAGRPLAGNLTVMASLLGGEFFPDPTGRILVLEEVGEPLYRIDRTLTQLDQAGVFSVCAGVVLGSFTGSGAGEVELRELFLRVLEKYSRPVVCGFPFGHGLPFHALNFSSILEMRGGEITLLFG